MFGNRYQNDVRDYPFRNIRYSRKKPISAFACLIPFHHSGVYMEQISEEIDAMICDLKSRKLKPEYIVMGKNICMRWLVETTQGQEFVMKKSTRYDFTHNGIPVVVCESEILEVLPNAKAVLGGA